MIANATACCRPPQSNLEQTASLLELSVERSQTVNLSFTDEAGRTYQLTVEKETSLYAATYDRQAQLATPGRRGRGMAYGHFQGRTGEAKRSMLDRQASSLARSGVHNLLHRFLKKTDQIYANHYRLSDPVEARARAVESEHAELLAVNQTVKVTLQAPDDMPADYWSVENTASRLKDFAVGLFSGGDRSAHAEKMIQAMEQGYEDALTAYGGALPEASRQTIDLAKELLSRWADQTGEDTAERPPALDLVA